MNKIKENRIVLFNPHVIRPKFLSFTTVPIQNRNTAKNPKNLRRKVKLLLSANLSIRDGTVIKIQKDKISGKNLSFSLAKK